MTKKHKALPKRIRGGPKVHRAVSFVHHTGEAVTVLSAGDFFGASVGMRLTFWVAAVLMLTVTALSTWVLETD